MSEHPLLSAEGLSISFADGPPVLDRFDLHIGAGSLTAVIGPSGCGKSTLLRVLAGVLDPVAGEITRPESVGYMPDRDLLMPWRTVAGNVALGPELAGAGREHARAQATELLTRFGLGDTATMRPTQLSTGMRQRAALLRTYLTGGDVMLLDEPLRSLDALTREQMQQWLLEVWESSGGTVLLVTHDVDEALLLADRVLVLSERPARVLLDLEVGLARPRPPELATAPRFAALKAELLAPLREAARRQARMNGAAS